MENAHTLAKRKAKYGRRDWVVWCSGGNWENQEAERHAVLLTMQSIKTAMLAHGTQGAFLIYSANDGHVLMTPWSHAVIRRNNLKRGF